MSIHTWRQTDCASIALNYYQFDMNFFHPEVHCILDGAHGYAVEECPWIYYIAAIAYKIFGFHEFLFRAIVLLLFFGGLYAVFRMTYLFTGDVFSSFVVGLFLFAFPVVAYYANNFLTNVPALSLDLIGLYFFFSFYKSKKYRFFIFSMLTFSLCGLSKVSSLISFGALFFLFLAEVFFSKKKENSIPVFSNKILSGFLFLFVILINLSWLQWAKRYNEFHHNGLFLMDIVPLWKFSGIEINKIFNNVLYVWFPFYFFKPTFFLTLFVLGFVFYHFKVLDKFIRNFLIVMLIGGLAYAVIFYGQFNVHDYYVLCLFSILVLVLISSLVILKKKFPNLFSNKIFRIVLLLILAINIFYSRKVLLNKYYGEFNYAVNPALYEPELKTYLKTIGLSPNDVVVMVPDISPNTSLYLANLKGGTNFPRNAEEEIPINIDVASRMKCIIVTDTNYLKRAWVKKYCGKNIGNYKDINIYQIDQLR